MKSAILTVLLLSLFAGGLNTISQVNSYSAKAAEAYRLKQYTEAITAYEHLLTNLELKDDQVRLNLAHAYYKAGRFADAQQQYRLLADNRAGYIRSIVHLQLGNIAVKQKKYKQGLSLYKQALIADPANEQARYNFELLKKYLDLNPEKEEQAPPQSQVPEQAPSDSIPASQQEQEEPKAKTKPDEAGNQEAEIEKDQHNEGALQKNAGTSPNRNSQAPQQQDLDQATGNTPGDTQGLNTDSQFDPAQQQRRNSGENISEQDVRAQTQRERLLKSNLSPERAKMLLDAMRNAELQYIQQLPKKAGKKPDRSKPDW